MRQRPNLGGRKLLVIYPPYYRFMRHGLQYLPLGPTYISATLRRAGYDVEFVNLDYKKNLVDEQLSFTSREAEFRKNIVDRQHAAYREYDKHLRTSHPAAVLINFHSSNVFHAAVGLAEMTKAFDQDILVIVGGLHPTALATATAELTCVDFVICGEGEQTIVELMAALQSGRDLRDVAGIAYKSEGAVTVTAERALLRDLDTLPFPTRCLEPDRRRYNSSYYGTMMISRGCTGTCRFCASGTLWKRKIRFRDPRNVLEEILCVQRRFGTREFTFLDDVFTVNPALVEELCSLIRKARLNILWTCLTRLDMVERDLVRNMKAAGCYGISVGVETGDPAILAAMDKKSGAELARQRIRLLQEEGILTRAFFMLGYPGETKQSLRNTHDLLVDLRPDSAVVFFTVPLPGSELHAARDTTDLSWNDYNINFPGAIPLPGLNRADLRVAQERMFEFVTSRRYAAAARLLSNPRYVYNRLVDNLFDLPKAVAYARRAAGILMGRSKSE